MKQKLVIALLLTSCAMAFTACSGDTSKDTTATTTKTEVTSEVPATTEKTSESASTENQTAAVTESETETEQSSVVPSIDISNDDGRLEYLSFELSKDYEDKPLIFLHFNFTNSSDKTASAQTLFYPKVFQNGIECDFGMSMDDNEAYKNLSKELQKGTTLEVAFPYVLQDTENPITLQVQEMSDMFSDGQTMEINLK